MRQHTEFCENLILEHKYTEMLKTTAARRRLAAERGALLAFP